MTTISDRRGQCKAVRQPQPARSRRCRDGVRKRGRGSAARQDAVVPPSRPRRPSRRSCPPPTSPSPQADQRLRLPPPRRRTRRRRTSQQILAARVLTRVPLLSSSVSASVCACALAPCFPAPVLRQSVQSADGPRPVPMLDDKSPLRVLGVLRGESPPPAANLTQPARLAYPPPRLR